jgi:NO-binding membrane sensor protein with MHYT domain
MIGLSGTALSVGPWQFVAILLLVFALFLILAGVFTAYFGSGKSRTVGVGLLVGGLVVGLLVGYFYYTGALNSHHAGQLGALIWEAFLVIVAAVIGALVAVGIFLVAIMKS